MSSNAIQTHPSYSRICLFFLFYSKREFSNFIVRMRHQWIAFCMSCHLTIFIGVNKTKKKKKWKKSWDVVYKESRMKKFSKENGVKGLVKGPLEMTSILTLHIARIFVLLAFESFSVWQSPIDTCVHVSYSLSSSITKIRNSFGMIN